MALVPLPRALDNRPDFGELRLPSQLIFSPWTRRHKARADLPDAGALPRRARFFAGDAFDGGDDFAHAGRRARAQIIEKRRARFAQLIENRDVRAAQIIDMNVVAQTGAVGRRVIGAKKF